MPKGVGGYGSSKGLTEKVRSGKRSAGEGQLGKECARQREQGEKRS